MFIFACTKTNQKVQPITWSDWVGLPCAAQNNRALRNSPLTVAQTVLTLIRLFLSANILLPTIDSAARLREMAFYN
jgi:hypothetical protein